MIIWIIKKVQILCPTIKILPVKYSRDLGQLFWNTSSSQPVEKRVSCGVILVSKIWKEKLITERKAAADKNEMCKSWNIPSLML